MANKKIYDVVIIGAGPAGLTAAIYASRRALKTLVLSKDIGGQASKTFEIENYPGFNFITGPKLISKFKNQAEKSGAEIKLDEVTGIDKLKKEKGFKVRASSKDEYQTKTIILAFGLTPKDLGVKGEDKFKGRGVSYCATCDSPLFKDKMVAVVGGGNSALETAELLAKIAKKVYLIHRRKEFRGDEILVKKVKNTYNIELVLNSVIKEIKGDRFVKSIILEKRNDSGSLIKCKEVSIDGVFVEVGYEAKTIWVSSLVELNGKGEIKITSNNETSEPGIFAAGDATNITYKQIIISASEGAKAGLQAYKYIREIEGKVLVPDWGRKKFK